MTRRHKVLIIDDSVRKQDYIKENVLKYFYHDEKSIHHEVDIYCIDNLNGALTWCDNNKDDIICIFLDLCFYQYNESDISRKLLRDAGYRFLTQSKAIRNEYLKDIPVILSSSEPIVDLNGYKEFKQIKGTVTVDTSVYIYEDIKNALFVAEEFDNYIEPDSGSTNTSEAIEIDKALNRIADGLFAISDAINKNNELYSRFGK